MADNEAETPDPDATRRPIVRTVARWTGLVLFVAVGFLYLLSGLVAPPWAVGVLWIAWLALLVALIRVWRSQPWLVLAAPAVAYVIWAAVVLAGDVFLGWTA